MVPVTDDYYTYIVSVLLCRNGIYGHTYFIFKQLLVIAQIEIEAVKIIDVIERNNLRCAYITVYNTQLIEQDNNLFSMIAS